GIAFTRRLPRDGAAEAVAAPRHRLDERHARSGAEQPAQARDRLLDAVVADRDILPAGFEQVVLGDDLAGAADEEKEDIELPIGHRYRLAGRGQAASCRIELETVEHEAWAARHAGIVTT